MTSPSPAHAQAGHGPQRRVPQRQYSSFATRTARDEDERLNRRASLLAQPSPPTEHTPLLGPTGQVCQGHDAKTGAHQSQGAESSSRPPHGVLSRVSHVSPSPPLGNKSRNEAKGPSHTDNPRPRPGAFPRPVGGTKKLGTFAGVFVPTSLNVLSILMFLRFGFILGQAGLVGMLGMLIVCYVINLLTIMSISAIATNGTVRGGGAYYLISRSLGPEFGGSIGIVFYLGMVFSTSMNAVGLVDCFVENFGSQTGNWANWLEQGAFWQYIWATMVLILCTAVCLAGSGLFARCSNGLLAVLLIAILSIPLSALYVRPFESRSEGIMFTGLSLETLRNNLLPRFTRGAAGSQLSTKENYQDLFGILFPATGGIFAGASMSGDLKHPSKAIPKGTLYGLALTFVCYALVILAMASSITRASLYRNANVIQLTNISAVIILLGEFATSAFSVLMGVTGSAKLLQALARDNLLPGLSIFGQGTQKSDDPIYAIVITYALAQITMLSDINQIASFITMAYLMTFLVTNLACFLLKIGSAPNFRPSFHFFNWQTAAVGAIASGATMFFVDGLYASACVALLIIIFLLIHYTTPPKPWGDVSQSLIYHQVRKYLLRLRQEHVKFWRPQILLLVNDPRRSYKLIQFCNSLKKGALFVLGHVIVSNDFAAAVPEARQQQLSWTKYIDFSRIKAFVNIAIGPSPEWGIRNIVLGAGLGGMRPNIVVLGFYNLGELRQTQPLIDIPSPQPTRPSSRAVNRPITAGETRAATKHSIKDHPAETLPTDAMKTEPAIAIKSYVTVIEDLILRLQINVAIAKGFTDLETPIAKPTNRQKFLSMLGLRKAHEDQTTKKYIDLYPIQMSAEIATSGDNVNRRNVLTTNFDTYTLILQLGCILQTVPSWKRTYSLRVCVFVEYESDVEEERSRVTTLLRSLRIEADVVVFWLASGDIKTYEVIVNNNTSPECDDAARDVARALEDEDWWQDMQRLRLAVDNSTSQKVDQTEEILSALPKWPTATFQHGKRNSSSRPERFAELHKALQGTRPSERKTSMTHLSNAGLTVSMRTQRLHPDLFSDSSLTGGEDSGTVEEALESESEASPDDDLDEYDLEASDEELPVGSSNSMRWARSMRIVPRSIPWIGKGTKLGRSLFQAVSNNQDAGGRCQSEPTAAKTVIGTSGLNFPSSKSDASSPRSVPNRPTPSRQHSLPKFTSNPTPRTAVASDEGGPSIMFVDTPSPTEAMKPNPLASVSSSQQGQAAAPAPQVPIVPQPQSIPEPSMPVSSQSRVSSPAQATGFPLAPSLPLSFNDLPCRAQHLILNELIRQNSEETAVVFTTLPSPVEGTCESEKDSVKFISDLEVLCEGLPPVLLVHSNSMTVTMAL